MPKFEYIKSRGLEQSGGSDGRFTTDMFPTHTVSGSVESFGTSATGTMKRPGIYVTSRGSAATITLPDPADCPGGVCTLKCDTAQAHVLTIAQPGGSGKISIPTAAWDNTISTMGTTATLGSAAVGDTISVISDGVSWLVIACRGTWTVA